MNSIITTDSKNFFLYLHGLIIIFEESYNKYFRDSLYFVNTDRYFSLLSFKVDMYYFVFTYIFYL